MALLFAREGAAVAVADVDAAAAAETAELARGAGGSVVAIEADAADEPSVRRMVDEAVAGLEGLDGAVLNVGVGAGFGVEGTSVEDWDRVLAVNLRSHFLGCKHLLPVFGDGAAIALIGSLAALEYMPIPAYGASKAALESLTRSAAIEGAPRVRVNLWFRASSTPLSAGWPPSCHRTAATFGSRCDARAPRGRWPTRRSTCCRRRPLT